MALVSQANKRFHWRCALSQKLVIAKATAAFSAVSLLRTDTVAYINCDFTASFVCDAYYESMVVSFWAAFVYLVLGSFPNFHQRILNLAFLHYIG